MHGVCGAFSRLTSEPMRLGPIRLFGRTLLSQDTRKTLALAACAICPAVIMGVFLTFTIWAPEWMRTFHVNTGSIMIVSSATAILAIVAQPVAGALLMRLPAWVLITVGGVFMGLGLVAASMLQSYLAF